MTQFRAGDYGCAGGASVRMKRKDGVVVIVAAAILAASIGAPVGGAGAAPAISPSTVATSPGHVGEPYEAVLSFTAGAAWSVVSGRLPPGLSLQSGEISGIPTLAGSYTFVVQADGRGRNRRPRPTPSSSSRPRPRGTRPGWIRRVVAREISPLPSDCNHTGYLTYAISALWRDEHVDDVNAKLATLKITQIGGTPKSCSSTVDESRNNLMLSLLIRPYMLYNADQQLLSRSPHDRGRRQPRGPDVGVRASLQQAPRGGRLLEHLRQREPRRRGGELLLPGRADLRRPPRVSQPGLRRRLHGRAAVQGVARPLEHLHRRAGQARAVHRDRRRRRTRATPSSRCSTSTTSPPTRCSAARPACSSTSNSRTTRNTSYAMSGEARRAAPTRATRTTAPTTR